MKNNLKVHSRVIFHSTSSIELDNKTGTILGIASSHPSNNFWIVSLDEPYGNRLAVVITDACIKEYFGVK